MIKSGGIMKKEEITERYEANIHLNTLYDVLSALQSHGKFWYPDDINKNIDCLIKKINNYIFFKGSYCYSQKDYNPHNGNNRKSSFLKFLKKIHLYLT